jgi:hypothetical protein
MSIAIKKVTAGVSANRPTVGYPGQIYIVYSATAAPEFTIWDQIAGDWVELNPTEMATLEGISGNAGTATASKYLITDAANEIDSLDITAAGTWTMGGIAHGYTDTTIANAAVKTLNATNVDVTAAPGAAYYWVFEGALVQYVYAVAAFDAVGAGDELEFEIETAAKVVGFCEAVGFVDQGADEARWVYPSAPTGAVWDYDGTAHLNKKIQVSVNTGSWFGAAGGGSLKIRTFHALVPKEIASFSAATLV